MPWGSGTTDVSPDQFNRAAAPSELVARVVVPPEIYGPPRPDMRVEERVKGPSTTFTESEATTKTTLPDGTKVTLPLGPEETSTTLPPGRPWPVDTLIGQVNGKAIYADQFLEGPSATLAQIGAGPDRARARQEIMRFVSARFEEEVNNRLIISEAESNIPPEAREGLFEFIRNLREEEVAKAGGTLSATETTFQEQYGMTVEQYLERRKNMALAGDLIRRRIQPRAIVSWRDIERAYERAMDEYAPGATVTIGRILVMTRNNQAKIAEVTAQLEGGADFSEVARELGVEKDGVWLEEKLGEKGLEGIGALLPEYRSAIKDLPIGKASKPIVAGPAVMWLAILEIDRPVARSLYDPSVQIPLRSSLERQRLMQEEERYFQALRSRWISDDIDQMRARLVDVALRRYLQ